MSGVVQLGLNYATNEVKAISVDANGKMDVDVELNTGAIATSANQTNGDQQAKVLGSETGLVGGAQKQLRVDGNGRLSIDINSGIPTKTDGSGGHSPATGIGLIGFEGSTARAIATDSSGHLQVDVLSGGGGGTQFAGGDALAATGTGTAMIGRDSGNVARLVATDTSGNLQVDILGNADTTKATSTLQTTANGHLSEIEGAVETIELCVSSNEMVINNKNAKPSNLVKNSVVSASTNNTTPILDTEGYRSIIVIGKTDSSSASWNIEWSDASDFAGGTDLIYNTEEGVPPAPFTPLAFQSPTSGDSALSYVQGIARISQMPQRYMRIRVFNTSGSNRDYTFFYQLSN